jgi:hypothetical protein
MDDSPAFSLCYSTLPEESTVEAIKRNVKHHAPPHRIYARLVNKCPFRALSLLGTVLASVLEFGSKK